MPLEWIVDELLESLLREGYEAKVTYCHLRDGTIISFEIKIIGRLE